MASTAAKEKKAVVASTTDKVVSVRVAPPTHDEELDATSKPSNGAGGGSGSGSGSGSAPQLDLSDDRTHMHVASLQFLNNPELEAEFCRDYHRKYADAVRNSLLFAIVLWALFVLLDVSKVRARPFPARSDPTDRPDTLR